MMIKFDLEKHQRTALYEQVIEKLELYYSNTKTSSVSPNLRIEEIRSFIDKFKVVGNSFDRFQQSIGHVIEGLEKFAVHTPHPKYFGLFNPRSNFASILADWITATYNPQMAAWSHAPFAVEVESKIIKDLGKQFGFEEHSIDGVFTTGGAEANLTVLLCAMNNHFSSFAKEGVFGLEKRPIIYCSEEAHHSINKAARNIGLGSESVRSVAINKQLQLDLHDLLQRIEQDTILDYQPFLLIATAGTTGAGAIDDLVQLKVIAQKYGLWFHVDAAYGGAAILNKQLKSHIKGIEYADSITFDAHKWLSVPMGAGIYITSHRNILSRTFGIHTEYMPKEANELEIIDPFTHSIQWSRRFIGLKLYLSLLFFGWDGYEKVIDHQTRMGDLFRKKLIASKWTILNTSPFPITCFTDSRFKEDPTFIKNIHKQVLQSGKSWLSIYPIHKLSTLRVCITNYATTEVEIEELVDELNQYRAVFTKEKR